MLISVVELLWNIVLVRALYTPPDPETEISVFVSKTSLQIGPTEGCMYLYYDRRYSFVIYLRLPLFWGSVNA